MKKYSIPQKINDKLQFEACSLEQRKECRVYQEEINFTTSLVHRSGLHPTDVKMICTVPQRIPRACPKLANLLANVDMEQYIPIYVKGEDIGIDYEKDGISCPNITDIKLGLEELSIYSDDEIIEQLDKIRPLTWIFRIGIKCHNADMCTGEVNPISEMCTRCYCFYDDVMKVRDDYIKLLAQEFDESN